MSAIKTTSANGKLVFRNPNFRVHKSLLRFVLPLSKFAGLPSNKNKVLVVGIIVLHPDTFAPEASGSKGPSRLLVVENEKLGGTEYEIPSGRIIFGTDQTLLESVVRITREAIGCKVTGVVKSIRGEDWSEAKESSSDGAGGAIVEEKESFKRYSFFVKLDSEDSMSGDIKVANQRYSGWRWATREEVNQLKMADEMRVSIQKAFDFVDLALGDDGKTTGIGI